jgi:hypothetical protein
MEPLDRKEYWVMMELLARRDRKEYRVMMEALVLRDQLV